MHADDAATARVRPRMCALVALLALAVALVRIPGLDPRAHHTLVVLVAAAGLWMTEALPVAVTALLIPVLGIALRAAEPKAAFAGFGDPIVFLFLGTFLFTIAVFDHGLDARLARAVLHSRAVRAHSSRLVWAVAAVGCGISAWVNNTATTAVILPLALTAERRMPRPLFVGVLLLASYAPSIGGIATPVGTAPNLIGLRMLQESAGIHVNFARWCAVCAPLAVLMTALVAAYFLLVARGRGGDRGAHDAAPAPREAAPRGDVPRDAAPLGAWSLAERTIVPLAALVITLWIGPGLLSATVLTDAAWLKEWSARVPETSVPVIGAVLLFVLPSGCGRERILDAGAFTRMDWSTLLLFGSGLSLGGMMFESGLARAIGGAIYHAMPISGELGVIAASTLIGVLISEVTSNTASASLVVPIVLAIAASAGVDPVKPAMAATLGCSFGFMLPVSTPPNALVYATGRVRIAEMIRYGVLLDVLGVVLITAWIAAFA
jgi:sodium-dependent dicarboxylate transporter 2/3/5